MPACCVMSSSSGVCDAGGAEFVGAVVEVLDGGASIGATLRWPQPVRAQTMTTSRRRPNAAANVRACNVMRDTTRAKWWQVRRANLANRAETAQRGDGRVLQYSVLSTALLTCRVPLQRNKKREGAEHPPV